MTRWLDAALGDLDALRLTLPDHPEDEFFAAGAPWFFTLFGRDSLWAARLALPVDVGIAASTLRVLARLQGTAVDPATAEQPGKIPHELRSAPLELPGEGVLLPPLYYGTVDATPLWVCLLADAFDSGMPENEVRELLPALRAALAWMTEYGDGSGHGFLDYLDETGHGLANQGWKDSGDSIQWRDGTLAQGPIALCEVQGYAHEAATRGADLLDALGETGGDALREWAAALRERFRSAYWVETPEGRYPGDRARRRPAAGRYPDEQYRAPHRNRHPGSRRRGAGRGPAAGRIDVVRIRHPDDVDRRRRDTGRSATTAAVCGPTTPPSRCTGCRAPACTRRHCVSPMASSRLPRGSRSAMPELHSGDPATEMRTPTPYPAACRPQAWSAAAAVACAQAIRAAQG